MVNGVSVLFVSNPWMIFLELEKLITIETFAVLCGINDRNSRMSEFSTRIFDFNNGIHG